MIDKVKPQALNSDVDSRNRPSNQMIDALNIAFEESYKDSIQTLADPGGGDFSGDFGAIKPMPSNRDIESILDLPDEEFVQDNTSIRVLGSVTDDIYNIIFFFVWSDMPEQMGVWAWDQDAVLPGNEIPESYIKVFTSNKFNFPSDGFVKADVVHIGQSALRIASARTSSGSSMEQRDAGDFGDPDLDVVGTDDGGYTANDEGYVNPDDRLDRVRNILLYFTDNRNEPKKLDVFKVMSYSQTIEDFYNDDDILDLICACPRTPEEPIRFVFDFDPDRVVSNFTNLPGVQFAYQYVYDDNVESAISTYSKLAVPPAYILLGSTSSSPYLQNRCRILIPRGTREVKEIRLLIRYGNAGSFSLIDIIKAGTGEGFTSGNSQFFQENDILTYNFYNDKVLVPVSDAKINMQYSNLPRVAQAQTVVSDRLLYGNYLENYPSHDARATITPIYGKTPVGGYHVEIKVKPFIIAPENYNSTVTGVGNSRVAGFELNMGGIPDSFGNNSIVSIEWDATPDDNFHIYNHHKSFHGTSEQFFHQYDGGFSPAVDQINTDSVNSDGTIDEAHHEDMMSGRTMFGKNKGLHFLDGLGGENNLNTWRCSRPNVNGQPGDYESVEIPCAYGTSAANPLILKAEPLYFKVNFQTNWDIEQNAPFYIRDAVYNLLTGGDVPMPMQDGIPLATVIDLDNTSSYSINYNLEGNEEDIVIGQDHGEDRLDSICAVKAVPTEDNVVDVMDQSPIGYFIVNRAQVTIGLKAYPNIVGTDGSYTSDNKCYLGLDLKSVNGADIRTCIPYVPWDHGGYQVGVPNDNAYISGVNTHQWGNVYFEQNDMSGNGNHVVGWMPPQIVNCTITKWKTFSRNYIYNTDPVSIIGYAPWENFISDYTLVQGPSNQTKLSDVGHKNLLYLKPERIFEFLGPFQQVENEAGQSYGASGLAQGSMGSAMFPVMNDSPGRFLTVGILSPPSGTSALNVPDLFHDSDEVSQHYGEYDQVFTFIDGEGNLGGVRDYTRDYRNPNDMMGVDTFYNNSLAWSGNTAGGDPTYQYYTDDPPVPNNQFGAITPYQVFNGHILPQPAINLWWLQTVNYGSIATFYRSSSLFHLRILHVTNAALTSSAGTSNMYEFYPAPHLLAGENYLLDGENLTPNDVSSLVYTPDGSQTYYDAEGSGTDYAGGRNNWVESNLSGSIVGLTGGEYYNRSFKTRANHEFGIVYYDQRGRSGHVNYLGTAYVKGYSDVERSSSTKGRVDMQVNITSAPPRWATHYQLVYGGNSTVREFVQYTTGLAFLENTDPFFDEQVDNDNAIIYVSLGYLQGVNGISYSDAYGAMHKSGNKDLYTYSEGDKLRILRYMDNDNSTVVYPDSQKYEFEIVGVKTLTSNLEDNILINLVTDNAVDTDTVVPMQKSGQFLMVKSNKNAQGFTYSDVAQAMPMEAGDYSASGQHFWNNNCIVEILKPKLDRDHDEKLYYEIGEKYDIVLDQNGNKVHEMPEIILRDGDVWWRPIPLNVPKFNSYGGGYDSIIKGTTAMGGNESTSRFRNYYLESTTFTDIIPDADGLDWGKPKVVVSDAMTLYKRSSITYSEKNNYVTKRNDLTIFNASTFNFKNLPNEYGSINYILNDYDSVFVIQQDKASTVPVSRNILSTAGGKEQLIASEKVLGTQKFYSGEYGADNNPESVARAEENIYWASKSKREVYKWSRKKGIEVISKNGMKAYFNNVFKRAIEDENNGLGRVRVVGGYDPLRDEFIISIHNMVDFNDLEGFYDFEMDGEYIVIDPDADIDPVIDDPIIVSNPCADITVMHQNNVNPSTLSAGDSVTFVLGISNSGGEAAVIEDIQVAPPSDPPHLTSITGVEEALNQVIFPGQGVEITIVMTVPEFYAPDTTWPFTVLFTYSSAGADCEEINTVQHNLPISVVKRDRTPKDPTGAFDGKSLNLLDSTDIPIPTISSNGNGGANGGGGFDEPGSGDPHGGGGIFDGGNGFNGDSSGGDENGSGDDIKIRVVPPTGNPENSFWLGGGGTGPSSGGGDDDVIPDTPPSINWCEYAWVGDDGLVTVGTVYSYWGANEDNIWNILPTALYDYLAEYVEGGATLGNFIEVYFIEEGPLEGYVSYQCLGNENGNGLIYDVNGDGVVNILDLLTLEEFIVSSNGGYDPAYDFNGDGLVDILDYAMLGDNMPEPPFDICDYIIDGEIGSNSLAAFLVDFESGNPIYDTAYEYFMSFYGMTAEQIGCRDPEDE